MPYRIIAKAAPFDVENSYHEIFIPGAFDEFLATPAAKKVPMRFDHVKRVGTWHDLHIAGGWLHAQGILDDGETEQKVRNGLDQLSIGYCNVDTLEAANSANGFDERVEALRNSRAGRGIDYMARRLSELPADVARMKLRELDEMPSKLRELFLMQAAQANTTVERVTRARLQEISIVDHGSFAGTRLHWEKI